MSNQNDIQVVEKHLVKALKLNNPLAIREAMNRKGVYRVPSMVDPNLSSVDLVKKYAERLGYQGKYRDGYIFRQFALASETIEQQEQFYDALDETIPVEKKSEVQRDIYRTIVEQKTPTYLYATVLRAAPIDNFTFIPVFQVLKNHQDSGSGNFVIRVGAPGEEYDIDADLPYMIISSPSMRKAMDAVYKIFLKFRTDESEFINTALSSGAKQIPISSHIVYMSRVLQFGEPGQSDTAGEDRSIYFLGQDLMVLQRVDPHDGYLLSVHRKRGDKKGEHQSFQFFFEITPPIRAVQATEFYRRSARLLSAAYFPFWGIDGVVQTLLGYYSFPVLRRYQAKSLVIGKNFAYEQAEIYEFVAPDGQLTVVCPVLENDSENEIGRPKAFVFRGTVPDLQSFASIPESNVVLEKTWVADQKGEELPSRVTKQKPALLGEIWVKGERGVVMAFQEERSGKRPRKEVLSFAVEPLDENATICCFAMSLLR